MTSTLPEEFILALDEEIEAIKKGKGGSIVKVFNGRFLREVAGMFVYAFNLENFLAVLDDTPAEIEIGKTRYSAQVLLTQGTDVEIGIEQFCGKFIPEANLHTNLWYLLELLKKKFVEYKYGPGAVNFSFSDKLFLGDDFSPAPTSQTPLKYSTSEKPPNEAQKQAIATSFSKTLCVVWGPPGTGKTKTIAATIEAHLNAGRRVLLVSHANNAVDEALEDVAEHLKPTPFYQEGKLVRLGIPQNYHLEKMKSDFPLVLLEGIAAKLGKSLSKEKDLLEAKKKQIDDQLVQHQMTLKTIQQVEALKLELSALGLARSECDNQRNSVQVELRRLQEIQNKNKERFNESHNAGAIKRFLKGLNPVEIQRSIDKTGISIDSKTRVMTEMDVRFSSIKQLHEKKEIEIKTAQIEMNAFLKKIGISESKLVATIKELEKQKDILLARINEINRQLDEIQKKILSEAKLVATTLTKTFSAKEFPDQPFDILILDEASMAPLPHLYWAASRCREFVTIVGDFLQLPPICISEDLMAQKWLGRSIFEVLGIQSVEGACADLRVRLLNTQYRMAPEISEICNRLFYQHKLKDDPSTFNQALDDGVSKSSLVLIETKEMNPWCSRLSAGSRFNLYDALVCATLAKRLIPAIESLRKDPESSSAKIGIIAPYAPQARLMTKIAKDWGLLDFVRISTVHKFQGGEEPIIIFDSVEGTGTRIASMLDDGQKDSDAPLLLNVAISRAKRKLYLVANTSYLISGLHPDSSLARITNHFLQKAEVVESESLVDNYFTADFEKWADLLLTTATLEREPVSGDPYTEKNFWAHFIQDLKSAKKRVIIHSPFLAVKRINKFMDYFRSMINKGIEIRIHTWPSNRQQGSMVEQSEMAIGSFRKVGVKVIEGYDSKKKHFKTAIIDDNILWDGSLNILSHGDTEEHMWRYEGTTAIEEIIRNLELDEENAVGNICGEECPKCGRPMVVRKSKYGTFLSCSTYPKCDGKMDISKSKMAKEQRVCPDCGKLMVIRRSAKGAFLGCTGYPVCRKTLRL